MSDPHQPLRLRAAFASESGARAALRLVALAMGDRVAAALRVEESGLAILDVDSAPAEGERVRTLLRGSHGVLVEAAEA